MNNVVKIINSRIIFPVIASLVFFMFDDWFIDATAITVLFFFGVIGSFIYLLSDLYHVILQYVKNILNIQYYPEKFLGNIISSILGLSISTFVMFLCYFDLDSISKQSEKISYVLKYCVRERCNDNTKINEGSLEFSNFRNTDLINGKFVITFSITHRFYTGYISCIFNSSGCVIRIDSIKGISIKETSLSIPLCGNKGHP